MEDIIKKSYKKYGTKSSLFEKDTKHSKNETLKLVMKEIKTIFKGKKLYHL